MREVPFIRLLEPDPEQKSAALTQTTEVLRAGRADDNVHWAEPQSFKKVPGSPFAYWVKEKVRTMFTDLPSLGSEERRVKQGLATADDFRFLRLWWEVPPGKILDGENGPDWREDLEVFQEWCRERTSQGKGWVPLAKGGEYSPYYADLHLVVNWENDGAEIKNLFYPGTTRTRSRPQNTDYYFRPGVTWTRRTQKGLSMRPFPAGACFGDKGPVIFTSTEDLEPLVGISNSTAFRLLVSLQMAFGSYEVGVIKRTVVPPELSHRKEEFQTYALEVAEYYRSIKAASELDHSFTTPALVRIKRESLEQSIVGWAETVQGTLQKRYRAAKRVDELVNELYGEEVEVDDLSGFGGLGSAEQTDDSRVEDLDIVAASPIDRETSVQRLLSYAVGCVMGRWDIRIGLQGNSPSDQWDPFDPLPVCPAGMLTTDRGLPVVEAPSPYPIAVDSDGILVDERGHEDDLVERVREAIGMLWAEASDDIEEEACAALGCDSLREHFQKTGKGGFWKYHVKQYSMSRRKAPIYWLLQSEGGSYSIWLSYHKLDQDTLHKVLSKRYLGGRIARAENALERLVEKRQRSGELTKSQEKERVAIEDLLVEFEQFQGRIQRILGLENDRGEVVGWAPHLEDGVVLNAAVLHELIPWPHRRKYEGSRMSGLEKYWRQLQGGEYDWSHTAMKYWPSRVLERCEDDRSLAIAHGLERRGSS